jgi:DNA-binding NtrC family response regulator
MTPMKKILIVDDDSTLRTALFRVLTRKGFQVLTAATVSEAQSLAATNIDLAILDVQLPDGNGLDLMTQFKNRYQNAEVIILTGNGSIEMAVQATQRGAYHFIPKPFNLDEFTSIVDKAIDHNSLNSENKLLKEQLRGKYQMTNIIGKSKEISEVIELASRVAETDSTVLITGESGTGKELVAKGIHYNSDRKDKPFVPINCGAIPAELLESELFGHVKGAFTGAMNSRKGRFEMAEGGTIFLDEIGDMSPTLQVKLLRVLQERQVEPVGSNQSLDIDVRVIAATHVNLEKAVAEGRFREDLYYRLNVIPIPIPSLKERNEDIPILIEHFLTKFNKEKKSGILGIESDALEVMMNYTWPGNIRELENLIERICILKRDGRIEGKDLPRKFFDPTNSSSPTTGTTTASTPKVPDEGMDFNSAVDAYENALILQALEKTGWNRNQAAILLSLNRTTLVEKIKKKGLKPKREATMDV